MVIAIQTGLDNLKQELLKRGYKVVDFGNYDYPIDVIIYEENLSQISYISHNNMPALQAGARGNYGVLVVNSQGKSVDEIEHILKTRSYSPLF